MKKAAWMFGCILFIFLFVGCAVSAHDRIDRIVRRNNLVNAIIELDNIISLDPDSYFATLAELRRAELYYELGLEASRAYRANLAVRLFLLSNTDKADENIIGIFDEVIGNLDENQRTENVLLLYNYILRGFYLSPRIPEFRYKRMVLFRELGFDTQMIWEDFKLLYQYFPESDFVQTSSRLVNPFLINDIIDPIFASREHGNSIESIIEALLEIRSYPIEHVHYVNERIADLYIIMAENYVGMRRFLLAESNFLKALQFDASRMEYVGQRLTYVCNMFIEEGNALLLARDIDGAIEAYRRSFDIVPGFDAAVAAIARAEQRRRDIAEAEALFRESTALIRNRENEAALNALIRANRLDPLEIYQRNIAELRITIEIERDPQGYAMRIIEQYRNGALVAAVEEFRDSLFMVWGNQLRDSDWRPGRTIGQNRVEVRYDLLTPETNFYLLWHVNMRERTVTPLNRVTEGLLE